MSETVYLYKVVRTELMVLYVHIGKCQGYGIPLGHGNSPYAGCVMVVGVWIVWRRHSAFRIRQRSSTLWTGCVEIVTASEYMS